MKLAIKQNVFLSALDKGTIGALTDEAQADTSNMNLIVQSIRLTADTKELSIESSTNLIAVQHTIPVSKDDGLDVEEGGCVFIPAKELYNWVKAQTNDAVINMTFTALSTPELISTAEEDDGSLAIKKIGNLKLVSKSGDKSGGNKWELDCYDPQQRDPINFSEKGQKCFDIEPKMLEESVKAIKFATADKDYEHVLTSVSIQSYKKDVYFCTTDTKRCALYKVDGVTNIEYDKPVLIPAMLLDMIAKISDSENLLSIGYNEDIDRVFISQKGLEVRLVCVSKEKLKKFPGIKMLLEKPYSPLADVPKSVFMKMLISASLVNKSSALFTFKADKDAVIVKAISEDGKYKPNVSQYSIDKHATLTEDLNKVWGVKHLSDVVKLIKSDKIKMLIPENQKSLKIIDEENKNFSYFAMEINNPKYTV